MKTIYEYEINTDGTITEIQNPITMIIDAGYHNGRLVIWGTYDSNVSPVPIRVRAIQNSEPLDNVVGSYLRSVVAEDSVYHIFILNPGISQNDTPSPSSTANGILSKQEVGKLEI